MKKQTYKWLRNVGLSLMGAAILTGCADENFDAPAVGDEVQLTFAVAEPTIQTTRAAKQDNYIEKLAVLIYKDSKLVHKQEFPKGETVVNNQTFSASVTLSSLTETDKYDFYAVTNYSSLPADNSNLTDLTDITDDLSGNYLTMSGRITGKTKGQLGSENIVLHRNAARLKATSTASNFTVSSWGVVNALSVTKLTAAATGVDNGTVQKNIAKDATDSYVYMAPKTPLDNVSVVIGGKFNGSSEDSWYRVRLILENNQALNSFEANHEYVVQVTNVNAAGYATRDEALKAPLSDMTVRVVDHAPTIYSFISTGTHTLAVPEMITLNNTATETAELSIKTICKEASCTQNDVPSVEIPKEIEDWVKPVGNVSLSSEGIEQDPSTDLGQGTPDAGTAYIQKLSVEPLVGSDYREGIVTVKWGSLTRTVKIYQTSQFNGSALGSFTITSTNAPNNSGISGVDYYDFLDKTAVGVDETAMCGVDRVQGFHFPMGLRANENGSFTTYSYKLTTVKSEYQGSYVIKLKNGSKFANKIKVGNTTLDGSNTASGTFNNGNNDIAITWAAGNSWEYLAEDGALIIEVTKDGKTTTFSYDLYHTGFFYNPSGESHCVSGKNPDGKFLYYEVIPVTAQGKTFHWLDRNIGATAAGMYIENENGASDIASSDNPDYTNPFYEDSKGNLYGISNSDNNTLDASYCPPGFRVPTVTEFNSMTNLSAFKTISTHVPADHWTAYLESTETDRQIYFPKNRYMQAGKKVGTGNTGYYWTCSAALGASGSEVGKWWQVVQISGGSASTNRIRAYEGTTTGTLTGLSIRAISNEYEATEAVKTYKLKVDGAQQQGWTHVYLYAIEGGTRVPLNNWPGAQIAPYNGRTKVYDFDFNSYTEYKQVYVILNLVKDNGELVKSWYSGTQTTAKPTDKGYLVMSGSNTPWDNNVRVTVPYSGASGDDNITYRVYWNTNSNKVGSQYNQLEVVDNGKTYHVNGSTYSSNSNYRYATYSTANKSIQVAPYCSSGGYVYKRDNTNNVTYWSLSAGNSKTVYLTIDAWDNYKNSQP